MLHKQYILGGVCEEQTLALQLIYNLCPISHRELWRRGAEQSDVRNQSRISKPHRSSHELFSTRQEDRSASQSTQDRLSSLQHCEFACFIIITLLLFTLVIVYTP